MSKKTAQINVAVTPELFHRVSELERKTGIKGTEMGRIGLVEQVNRLEQNIPAIPLAEAKALAELRALHIDPLPHLEAIIKDAIESPLPVQVGLPATI